MNNAWEAGKKKKDQQKLKEKREGLSFGLMSLFFLLFHSLVSGREVHEDAPDV